MCAVEGCVCGRDICVCSKMCMCAAAICVFLCRSVYVCGSNVCALSACGRSVCVCEATDACVGHPKPPHTHIHTHY